MRLTTPISFFCLINLSVLAHSAEDGAPNPILATSSSSVETVLPNYSYLLKLDCISCPFLIRQSDRNEWEKDPRPNQLTLALYIEGELPSLHLAGYILYPLWYDRQAPPFYGSPDQYAPPFAANQIGINETLQREENNNGYGMPLRQFDLAYEFNAITYAPGREMWKWEAFIEFEITGLRHEEHVPKDIPFSDGTSHNDTENTIPGVNSIVRVIVGYTGYHRMKISAVELMHKEEKARWADREIEALRKGAELKEEESIATPSWGGRLRDINGPDGKDMYTSHASFRPGEWNDCGRKDEWGRQVMCKFDPLVRKLETFNARSPALARLSLVLMAIALNGMLILLCFASWLAIQSLRGQKTEEVVTAEGENDALLLFGDEDLEDEEKAEEGIGGPQATNQSICTVKLGDSQQFGSYQQNIGSDLS